MKYEASVSSRRWMRDVSSWVGGLELVVIRYAHTVILLRPVESLRRSIVIKEIAPLTLINVLPALSV